MAHKVRQGYLRGISFRVSVDSDTAQTNASVKTAPSAGYSIYLTDICVSMGATSRAVQLLDGSAGTILWEVTPAANGIVTQNLKTPIKLTAATALCITTGGASAGLFVDICGFVAAD